MTLRNILILIVVLALITPAGFFWFNDFVIPKTFSQSKSLTTHQLAKVPIVASTSEPIRVPIFVYHSVAPLADDASDSLKRWTVTPEVFEQQLKYLQDQGYHAISFTDLVNHFASSTPLPTNPIILSFDDGWRNQYTYAFPLLQKYGFTATFFVFSNAIGHPNYFSWDQLIELKKAGMIIGDHTMYHPYLFKITDQKTLYKEIVTSKEILEKNLGIKIDTFAYPFGRFNPESIEMIKKSGYIIARTNGYNGHWHAPADLYTLKSYNAMNDLGKFITDIQSQSQLESIPASSGILQQVP